jgi:hypothetical protein
VSNGGHGVRTIGRSIGGRNNDHVPLPELVEESSEQHGIGNVGHLELIEAEQLRLRAYLLHHVVERIFFEHLMLRAVLVDLLVHGLHERVEVHARLVHLAHVMHEEVHEHRLAAAHAAPDVQSARGTHLCADWLLRHDSCAGTKG